MKLELIVEQHADRDPRYRIDVLEGLDMQARGDDGVDIEVAMFKAIIRLPTCNSAKFKADAEAIEAMKRRFAHDPSEEELERRVVQYREQLRAQMRHKPPFVFESDPPTFRKLPIEMTA